MVEAEKWRVRNNFAVEGKFGMLLTDEKVQIVFASDVPPAS